MKRAKNNPLSLEVLEDRCCPSVSVHVTDGTLHVADDQSSNLLIRQTSKSSFAVVDNGVLLGNYNVTRDVDCVLSAKGDNLTVDLNGYTSPHDINLYGGSGDNSEVVAGGTVGGKLKIAGGPGSSQIELGQPGGPGLSVLGETLIHLGQSPNDALTINGEVRLKGDLIASSANSIVMKAGSAVDGNFFISGAAGTNDIEIAGAIAHALRIDANGTQANTIKVDSSAVMTDFFAALAAGNNELDMNGVVHNKLAIIGQSSDTIDLNGSVGATAFLHLVGRSETLHLSGTIDGDLKVHGGSGTVAVTFSDLDLKSPGVVRLGSGNDTFTMGENVSFPPGSLSVYGGPGDDTYTGSTQGVNIHGFKHVE